MGRFSVTIEVADPDRRGYRAVAALVDTGASFTTLPAALVRDLGVVPHTRGAFVLATGETVTRDIGRTWVRVDGREEMTMVVFGEDNALALLGAVTLEELRLGVDPIARKLIPVPGLLA